MSSSSQSYPAPARISFAVGDSRVSQSPGCRLPSLRRRLNTFSRSLLTAVIAISSSGCKPDTLFAFDPRRERIAIERRCHEIEPKTRPLRQGDPAVADFELCIHDATKVQHLIVGEVFDVARVGRR